MENLNWNSTIYTNLREAYLDLLYEKPIQQISVMNLSSKAGYSRSTFYQRFADIYELDETIKKDILSYLDSQLPIHDEPIKPTTKILVPESTYDIYNWLLACQKRKKELLLFLTLRPDTKFIEGLRKQIMSLVKRVSKYDDFPDDRQTEYYLISQTDGTLGMLIHFLQSHSDEDPAPIVYIFNGVHRLRSWVATGASKEVRATTLEMLQDILEVHRQNREH